MPETATRVSYIITTRNRADFLAQVLRNTRDFLTPQDELIVIDGASTDHTAGVIAANRDIVRHFVSEKDRSEGHAFNKALYLAAGEFIKPLADDDYVRPDVLGRAIELMQKHPEIDVLQCGGEIWEGTPPNAVLRSIRRLDPEVAADPVRLFWDSHHFLGMIFRRRAAVLVGGVNPMCRSIDGDLLQKFIESQCVVKYWDVNLYRWYIHPHSGINRMPEVRRDHLAFSQRLSGQHVLFELIPEEAADAYGMAQTAQGLAFARIVRGSYRLLRSPGWRWLLSPLALLIRAACLPLPRRHPARPACPVADDPWTGRLS